MARGRRFEKATARDPSNLRSGHLCGLPDRHFSAIAWAWQSLWWPPRRNFAWLLASVRKSHNRRELPVKVPQTANAQPGHADKEKAWSPSSKGLRTMMTPRTRPFETLATLAPQGEDLMLW